MIFGFLWSNIYWSQFFGLVLLPEIYLRRFLESELNLQKSF